MGIREHVQLMKQSSPQMAASPLSLRDRALQSVKESLLQNKEAIFRANEEDLCRADAQQIAPAVRKRLKFDAHKLADVCAGIDSLLSLPDPVGRVSSLKPDRMLLSRSAASASRAGTVLS